ncbi:nitrous oxide reductase accessory protein NosL [Desulforhopalus sp. IMCC35007]|uniref:nitrous oxide reductase accessory protein NosL n=1 Tax=Desulforhopalus sp. IMCC35007 TaxID=2569543 RepID=UPI00145D9670|nr:nitrous oxide reductase accessory protein NosL [Desulforhopalus sp. IMCC35007]
MKKIGVLFVVIALFCSTGTVTYSADRKECTVCGMYIDLYQKTAGHLELTDGKILESCGLACLLRIVDDHGGPDAFTKITVKAWWSGQVIDAQQATYVLSSTLIPDMMPSIIAFATQENASRFQNEYGGVIISFTEALLTISPTAMTMPTRLQTAVVPAQGAFAMGLGQMYMQMDDVLIDNDSVSPSQFIKRPGQMMGPKKMTATGTMLMANYGLTDDIALGLNTAYIQKEMEMYQMGGMKTVTEKNDGLSDTNVSLRYNFFKSVYYNHFLTALAESSLPTGEFDKDYISRPGLQTGTGDFTFTGGLLYTYRFKKAWLHSKIAYTHKLENSDDYKFGDETRFGLALHYTPNYDTMLGVEADATYYDNNELNSVDIGNSGGWRSNVAGVASYRFLTALGGNFDLKLAVGIPVYEDLNHGTMMGQDTVQLGGGWFGSLSVSFKRRFSHEH